MKQLWDKIVAMAGSNVGLKALALIIAIGLWLAGHRDTERAIEVPVEFRSIPPDLMVVDNRVDYVVLRVMGPRTLVSTLDAEEMKLALDLNGAKPGSLSIPLAPNYFNIPRGVTVARITPPVVHLRLEPVVRRTLPVSVRTVTCASSGTEMVKSTEPGKLRGRGTTVRTSTRFACSTTWISISCSSARAAFWFGRCTRLIASMATSRPAPPVITILPDTFDRSNVPF